MQVAGSIPAWIAVVVAERLKHLIVDQEIVSSNLTDHLLMCSTPWGVAWIWTTPNQLSRGCVVVGGVIAHSMHSPFESRTGMGRWKVRASGSRESGPKFNSPLMAVLMSQSPIACWASSGT